jgi:hypothetical protein
MGIAGADADNMVNVVGAMGKRIALGEVENKKYIVTS